MDAQFVTIPDTNFVNWLNNNGYSACMNGNQMDTTCNLIINATTLNCSGSDIQSLEGITYFDNLDTLNCAFADLGYLPTLPLSTTVLYVPINNLSSLPDLPAGLRNLGCSDNQLTTLPSLPDSLNYLWVSGNFLTTLPSLPDSLLGLDVSRNLFDSLPPLPSKLTTFSCRQNSLDSLPLLPDSLINLQCYFNNIHALPILPSTLVWLECGSNPLEYLPELPDSLERLSVSFCGLDSLPDLPFNLTFLDCKGNNLDFLPTLPIMLKELYCETNNLTWLPLMPPVLQTLVCNENNILTLPILPSSLKELLCAENPINILPDLPDSLDYLGIQECPNLYCIPYVKYIDYMLWYSTPITCLPGAISIITSWPPDAGTLPICSMFNPQGCESRARINGKVFFDNNSDCLFNAGEATVVNSKVKLFSGLNLMQQTFTDINGGYAFEVDTGSFTIIPDSTTYYSISCPASGFLNSVLTEIDSIDYDMDFALQCKSGFDVGVSTISQTSGQFRPANNATVNVLAGDLSNQYNLHCASGINGTVTVVINGPASYKNTVPGALIPIVNGNILVYSITDFGTVNFNSDFAFVVQTDTTAQIGQQVCFDVNVDPVVGDNDPSNNTYTHCFNVVNSFDPNDKQVSPFGIIDTTQEWLTYTIRFQNTGNALAQHIYILDTLDSNIDESSIQLLAYSHEPIVQVVGDIVRFNFPNINLPDSVNDEPNSHGYVQYKARLKDNLPLGTQINNTANIYFDFNQPVVTNTTVNTIDIISDIHHQYGATAVKVYPNPFTSSIAIESSEPIVEMHIFDMTGRMVYHSYNKRSYVNMDLTSLNDGVYIMEVIMVNSTGRLKIVKK